VQSAPGLLNGPLTSTLLSEFAGARSANISQFDAALAQGDVSGYVRRWSDLTNTHAAVIMLFDFNDAGAAQSMFSGLESGSYGAHMTPFAVTTPANAQGFYHWGRRAPAPPIFEKIVDFIQGDFVVSVITEATNGAWTQADVAALAQRESVTISQNQSTLTAYKIGTYVGDALLVVAPIGLPLSIILWIRRRSARSQATAAALPAKYVNPYGARTTPRAASNVAAGTHGAVSSTLPSNSTVSDVAAAPVATNPVEADTTAWRPRVTVNPSEPPRESKTSWWTEE
jgi:hypothetical protein